MKKLIIALLASFILLSCGHDKKERKHYSVSQVDALIRDLSKEKSFSIILNDMDTDGENYKHRYRVILQKNGTPKDSLLDWKPVTPKFFEEHENDMGMEIASKDSLGKVSKKAVPPGYTNYVGNAQYGHWTTGNDGQAFWQFYGQYMFMQSVLGLNSPIYRTEYHTYTTVYRNTDRPYYGTATNGQSHYGTNSYSSSPQKTAFRQKMSSISRSDGSKVAGYDRRSRYNNTPSTTSGYTKGTYNNTPSVAKTTTSSNNSNSYTYGGGSKNYQSSSLRNTSTSRSVTPAPAAKKSWWGGSSSSSKSSSRSSSFGRSSKRR